MTATAEILEPSTRQREAIEAPLGPVLVLAGPGAGKTFCLIERIRFLISQHQFDPKRICAVTFTNKAAQEIAERLEKALGPAAAGVKGGTLHALCVEILRQHGEAIGVRRGFGIADEEYQRDVLRRIGVYGVGQIGMLTRFGVHRTRGTELSSDDLHLFRKYREHLDRRNLLDFDDLVVRTAELFRAVPEIAEEVAARWDYVLVDEFQDLNPRQYEVVKRLAWGHKNLFVVGDDEQSVFSWTGADPRILRVVLDDFGVGDIIVLDQNHRTARQIFTMARRLLERNPRLFDQKALLALRETEYAVTALSFDSERSEARWLLQDLQNDRAASGLPWGEYGVLYRRHEIGSGLEAEFIKAGVPCRLAAGRALRDNPVVKYLVSALQVIAAPNDQVHRESFARAVLPHETWRHILSEAQQRRETPSEVMARLAKGPKSDETVRKLVRTRYALQNLAGQASRHSSLISLVEDILSQRVGEYRTVLESNHEELTDPSGNPSIVALAGRLKGAMHGRKRVWLPRMGGLELALSGLLMRAGITSVAYGTPPGEPGDADVVIHPGTGGTAQLAIDAFKAMQIVHTSELKDVFQDFVVIDSETTDKNTSTCEIIELAAVRVRGGRIVDRYQQLIRPRGTVSEGARRTHGITDAQLRDQPMLEAIWPAFRAFCADDVLVAHNGNGFDFPILRRLGKGLPGGAEFVTFDSLPLAYELHRGSRKLVDLAHHFGVELAHAHRAEDDARALAEVFLRLQEEKLARTRKTALVHLLDYLGLALAVAGPGTLSPEGELLWRVSRSFTLGRLSDCLEYYGLARSSPDAFDAPSLDDVVNRLGGRRKMEEVRQKRRAADRYPLAMARLRLLLEGSEETTLPGQLREFLDRVTLSYSGTDRQDPDMANGVNLLTMHSTKGLEFSRVYIVGAEDAQMLLNRDGKEPPDLEVEESRRLLYVGMTRAKDRLILTRAERRKDLATGGYRFLEEMGLTPRPPG